MAYPFEQVLREIGYCATDEEFVGELQRTVVVDGEAVQVPE